MGDLASLTEIMSEGKSGSFFYFSHDMKFMVKTISMEGKLGLGLAFPLLPELVFPTLTLTLTLTPTLHCVARIRLLPENPRGLPPARAQQPLNFALSPPGDSEPDPDPKPEPPLQIEPEP